MADDASGEPFRHKVYLLVIDKLALGLVIAIASGVFTWQLQRHAKAIEYQQALFAKRQEAYQALVVSARAVRDELSALYIGAGAAEDPQSSLDWSRRLAVLDSKALHAAGFGGAGGSFSSYSETLKTLRALEHLRRENELYISSTVDTAIDQFLEATVADLDEELTDRSRAKDMKWQREAAGRAEQAYDRLVSAMRKSLRVDDVILG